MCWKLYLIPIILMLSGCTIGVGMSLSDSVTCDTLNDSSASLSSLVDFNDPQVKELHDLLLYLDATHAYPIFVRAPKTFIKWLEISEGNLHVAVHETNHMINFSLSKCHPKTHKCLLKGEVYYTNLHWYETAKRDIVKETLPEHLKLPPNEDSNNITYSTVAWQIGCQGKSADYYTYIDTKNNNNCRFNMLIDELNAYTGDAWFQILVYKAREYYAENSDKNALKYFISPFQIHGVIIFMTYLECYLKAARLNHRSTYDRISEQPDTLAFISHLWTTAEEVIEAAFPIIQKDSNAQSIFFSDSSQGIEHLIAAYSPELLEELDLLGIPHKPENVWENTYFSLSKRN